MAELLPLGSRVHAQRKTLYPQGAFSLFLATSIILITSIAAIASSFGGSPPRSAKAPTHSNFQAVRGNSQLLRGVALTAEVPVTTTTVTLPAATTPPAPAPPSLSDAASASPS